MSDPVIQIQSLSRRFGKKQALDDVSLEVNAGCVFGLVGENGAGKTTLLKHILGLLRPSTGNVRVFNLDPVADPELVLSRIGFLSEDRDMPEWMQIQQLLTFQASFFPNWDQAYANELIEMFELTPKQRITGLSRGQRARVGLLLAIAHRPELLVLDEPSSGLDPVVRRDILAAIIRTVADEGRTVLFSSHLLDEVQRVSDHVAMLHNGELLLSDRLDAVLAQHSRWTVRFPQPVSDPPQIPGSLSCRGAGCEWDVICNGQAHVVQTWIDENDVEVVEQGRPSLDEIFVARVGSGKQTTP